MTRLPLFINKENRFRMGLLAGGVFLTAYSIPNRMHWFPLQQLPLTNVDLAIPFIPWFVWIYISEYIMFITGYFAFEDDFNRNRYIWAYLGVLLIGVSAFTFFPTVYPRQNYPLPDGLDPLTYLAFTIVRLIDLPTNCFPSMHVACCYITAMAFNSPTESRKRFWFYFVWATLVAMSTLPTKQHYFADVIGGLVVAYLGHWFFFKKATYVSLAEYFNPVHQDQ